MNPVLMAVVTAVTSSTVGALVGALVAKVKLVRQAAADAKRDSAELRSLILQNTKMTCRLTIYDEHFSVDEKLEAYEVYRAHGWNHQTKTYMDGLVGCDVDEYLDKHRG